MKEKGEKVVGGGEVKEKGRGRRRGDEVVGGGVRDIERRKEGNKEKE